MRVPNKLDFEGDCTERLYGDWGLGAVVVRVGCVLSLQIFAKELAIQGTCKGPVS